MKSLNHFLLESLDLVNERFINLIGDDPRKDKYKQEVYDLLQKSYAPIGGLRGSGFKNPDDMKNISFWKIATKNGKIVAVKMYKDKGGRKSVATGTDGSTDGLEKVLQIMKEDFKFSRTWVEISGKALSIAKRAVGGNIKQYAVDFETAKKKLASFGDEIRKPETIDEELIIRFPELVNYFYERKIGSEWHIKVVLGNVNSDSIVRY